MSPDCGSSWSEGVLLQRRAGSLRNHQRLAVQAGFQWAILTSHTTRSLEDPETSKFVRRGMECLLDIGQFRSGNEVADFLSDAATGEREFFVGLMARLQESEPDLFSEDSVCYKFEEGASANVLKQQFRQDLTPLAMRIYTAWETGGPDVVEICCICKENIRRPARAYYEPVSPCQHVWCAECILQWTQNSSTCPECRYELSELLIDEERVRVVPRTQSFYPDSSDDAEFARNLNDDYSSYEESDESSGELYVPEQTYFPEQEEYEVDSILNHRRMPDGDLEFALEWKEGISTRRPSWYPLEDLHNCPEVVKDYYSKGLLDREAEDQVRNWLKDKDVLE